MRKVLLTLVIALAVQPIFAQEADAEKPCYLNTYKTLRYVNQQLIDSAVSQQGTCNGVVYKTINDGFTQYLWSDTVLTVYPQSNMVTLANTVKAIQQPIDVKVKRKNIPKQEAMDDWSRIAKIQGATNIKTEEKNGYLHITYRIKRSQVMVKVDTLTNEAIETVTTTKTVDKNGQINLERIVHKRTESEPSGLRIEAIIDPNQVIDLNQNTLTSSMINQGFTLYNL